jgi:uncharacterized protein (DUF736 family)
MANITLQPNDGKDKDLHPDYIVLHGQIEIGVAWNRNDDRGFYISIAFEEPSLAAGFYTIGKTGVEKATNCGTASRCGVFQQERLFLPTKR